MQIEAQGHQPTPFAGLPSDAGHPQAGPGGDPNAESSQQRTYVLPLPDGRQLALPRSRWAGPLNAVELEACRRHGISLAYDCAQLGWIPAESRDEATEWTERHGPAPTQRPLAITPEATAAQVLAAVRLAMRSLPTVANPAALTSLRRHAEGLVAEHAQVFGGWVTDPLHLTVQALLSRAEATTSPALVDEPSLHLRPWTSADAPRYRELLDEPKLWAYLPESYPGSITLELAQQLLSVSAVDPRQEVLAVERDGRAIGQCLLRFAEPVDGVHCAEVAYWLGREYWGQGIMQRLLPHFLQRSFRAHRLDLVFAWIHTDHLASARVAMQSRFRKDTAPHVPEVAKALKKPAFLRYVTTRPQWAL